MVYLLWDESDYEMHLIGVFQTAQEAFKNRTEQWQITCQEFGMLKQGYGRPKWASYNSHDDRHHLAMMKSDGDTGFTMVGIDRVVKLLSQ